MIRASFTVSAEADEGLQRFDQFLKDFDRVVGELASDTFAEIRQPFLNELQFYPPVPPNSRYRRTYRLRNSWTVRLVKVNGAYQIFTLNATPYAKWVVGSFDQRRNYQTDFHARNGWPLANQTVTFWYAVFQEEYQARFDRYLAGFGIFSVRRRNR